MTLLQSFSFTVNTEGTFAEQYPDLRTGFYSQQISINGTSYTFKIFPNFYMENPAAFGQTTAELEKSKAEKDEKESLWLELAERA